ncbi:general secretion pathway protein GspB, partial [Massilia agilis]
VAPGPAPAHDAAVAQHPPAAASPAPAVALVGAPDAPPAAAKPARPPAEPVRKAPEPAPAATSVPAEVAKPAVVAPVSADDGLPTLNGLPDAVRRDVPKVAFGGYMYSPNPADRLVLVDKTLRHEGEEVAPGLMLEKLLPKGAVLNFRGYRYRVPF